MIQKLLRRQGLRRHGLVGILLRLALVQLRAVQLLGIHRLRQHIESPVFVVEENLHIGHPGAEISAWEIASHRTDFTPEIRVQLVADFGRICIHGVQNPLIIRTQAEQRFFICYNIAAFLLLFQGQLVPLLRIHAAGIAADMGLQNAG